MFKTKDFGTSLNKKYSNDWLLTNEMLKDGKLSTYIFFENLYLDLNIENQFVDCAYQHTDFSVEMGRFNNTRSTERICKNCTRNEIEDEEHFIIRYNKFTKESEELFELISSKVTYLTQLQDKQKLFWILNCTERNEQ